MEVISFRSTDKAHFDSKVVHHIGFIFGQYIVSATEIVTYKIQYDDYKSWWVGIWQLLG
jgi:hypothetical protein